ncbi:MAG: class IV adenylate cyclase [Anaerolineales bacterium]|nr:class IV adenylate cyclase [Anaerolineales bacterium]
MPASGSSEIEAKFLAVDLPTLRKRALKHGGQIRSPRHLERNLRFDTRDGRLQADHAVLRLREDAAVRLTFKRRLDDFEHREEIECVVSDAEQAQRLLEALGYEIYFIYEKYREVIAFGVCELMLDDLPFGSFLEIEGPDVKAIQACAASFKLTWEHRLNRSYPEIFSLLKEQYKLDAPDATFEHFQKYRPVDRAAWRAWLGKREDE